LTRALPPLADAAGALPECVAFLARHGLAPATSSNFSCRTVGAIAISCSGVDKHA
jgi:ribulose-5-phosphate 4-epimerase/fuculose-1-phosphate aldolase